MKIPAFLESLAADLPSASKLLKEGSSAVVDQASLRGPLDMVAKAVNALPNTSALFPVRETYLHTGYAIKASLGDTPEAFDLFASWCARWTDGVNDPEVVESDWRRMKPPFRRGYRWLTRLAHEHSAGAFNLGEIYFEPPTEALFPETARTQPPRFRFETFDEAAERALNSPSLFLIKGLLDQEAMSVIYGAPNKGKTFVALDIAYRIAKGIDLAGLEVCPGAIVYVATEGGGAIRRRIAALRKTHGLVSNFHLLPSSIDLFDPNADVEPLIAAIIALSVDVKLLTIDTVARAIAGGDENSAKDMGAYVKNVDRIREAVRTHVMSVHHSGKDASKGARGSSALLGAVDTEIEVDDGCLSVTKQRDMDKSLSVGFALEVVDIGLDLDGHQITSCIVRWQAQNSAAPLIDLTQAETEVLAAAAQLSTARTTGFREKDVVEFLKAAGSSLEEKGVRRHLRRLDDKGRLTKIRRATWVVRRSGGAGTWFEAAQSGGIFD